MLIWDTIVTTMTKAVDSAGDAKSRPDSLAIYPLDEYGFIRISGPDAEKFLQGQVTCDCRRLINHEVLLGAHCNPKGRMISSFIASTDNGDIVLRLHASIVDSSLQALKKYSVFARVQLEIPETFAAFTLVGSQALAAVNQLFHTQLIAGQFIAIDGCSLLALNAGVIEFRGEYAAVVAILAVVAKLDGVTPRREWDAVLLDYGWAEVRAATAEQYIPQMFNYHLVDGVSFKKGCYTGQEIVARMQYLGKLKKHLYSAQVDAMPMALAIGDALRLPSVTEPQGEIVAYAVNEQGARFLAVVNDAAVNSAEAYIERAPESKISWLKLPYAIP